MKNDAKSMAAIAGIDAMMKEIKKLSLEECHAIIGGYNTLTHSYANRVPYAVIALSLAAVHDDVQYLKEMPHCANMIKALEFSRKIQDIGDELMMKILKSAKEN